MRFACSDSGYANSGAAYETALGEHGCDGCLCRAPVGEQVTIDSADVAGWQGGMFYGSYVDRDSAADSLLTLDTDSTWDFSWLVSIDHRERWGMMPPNAAEAALFSSANLVQLRYFPAEIYGGASVHAWPMRLTADSLVRVGSFKATDGEIVDSTVARFTTTALLLPVAYGDTRDEPGFLIEWNSYGGVVLPGGGELVDILVATDTFKVSDQESWTYGVHWFSKSIGHVASLWVFGEHPLGLDIEPGVTLNLRQLGRQAGVQTLLKAMYLPADEEAVAPRETFRVAQANTTPNSVSYNLLGQQQPTRAIGPKAAAPTLLVFHSDGSRTLRTVSGLNALPLPTSEGDPR